jgi:hypothetical protein
MRPQRSLFETAPGREIHPRNLVFATVILIRDGQEVDTAMAEAKTQTATTEEAYAHDLESS